MDLDTRADDPKRIPKPEDKDVLRRRSGITKGDSHSVGIAPGCKAVKVVLRPTAG